MSVRNQSGFTVFEMMIVVVIAAMVTAFAIPAMQETLARSRVSGASEEVSNAMATARNMAVSKRRPLMLNMNGSEWQISQATTSLVLPLQPLQRGTLNPGVTVGWPATQLTFDTNGRVTQTIPVAAPVSWTVSVCDTASRREEGRNVTVSRIGRIQTTKHASAAICNP
jgi:prepilin-type N-terminal cleavage/methylation domain-containing protein